MSVRILLAVLMLAAALVAQDRVAGAFDPLALARSTRGRVENLEATVPPQCYTKTDGISNPCWTCHTVGRHPNFLLDYALQEEYAFSSFALTNRWTNLFDDRSAAVAKIDDAEILAHVRGDNYAPLREHLGQRRDYRGWKPDLDLARGFDPDGFARDGSGWRAIRYKPFPGTFWPTNGSTDDVMIRLPRAFRSTAGQLSREVYKINLSILEAAITADPDQAEASRLVREVEALDEAVAGTDLDGDGRVGGRVTQITGLPSKYVGDAESIAVRRYLFPAGTEFFHSVRYLDPEAPGMRALRMKELRYSRKVQGLDTWGILRAYEKEAEHKDRGRTPVFAGTGEVGLRGDFGWQLTGFIEDARGRLRLQTDEETRFCMGCHGPLGVTVDHTFTLARKIPGSAGWRYQDLRGQKDVPQAGHPLPEVRTYFERVRGGDEFRANDEMIRRFMKGDDVNHDALSRAAPGGDRDLAWLLLPTPERALALDKAYRVLVQRQSFTHGRHALVGPLTNIHPKIENGSTDLKSTGRTWHDGRLWLDWTWPSADAK